VLIHGISLRSATHDRGLQLLGLDRSHRCVSSFLWIVAFCCFPAGSFAGPPQSMDSRLVMELVAKEPQIVTPTGLAVDEHGRVWVIENNTHERPADYKGPPSDRVRICSDFGPDGKARKITTFAEGFKNAMSLALDGHGGVYLATRADIYLLRDPKGRDVADERRVIVRLATPGEYPHNGLSGFAFDGIGDLYFGLGENLGAPYKLIGADGTTLTGGGEGGSIYRCRPDGTGLTRTATGFWNPFHLTFDAFGRLFAVDNDPDSRGPCRLLHIIPGGDYGYRFRNGRKGLHPFTAWNGELPGTLPMVAGTSEAPCAVLAYESTGLPDEYRGDLLVTSWGDHLIERFHLTPRGASFASQAQAVVRGGEDFRPVALATAPDGSLYLSDWVDKSYPVHGKGRVWRLRMKTPPPDDGLRVSQVASLKPQRLRDLLGHPKREIRAAAGAAFARDGAASELVLSEVLHRNRDPRARLEALWALIRSDLPDSKKVRRLPVYDSASEVRAEAVRSLGELPGAATVSGLKDESPYVRLQATEQFENQPAPEQVVPILVDKDPFLAGAALAVLGRPENAVLLLRHADDPAPRMRLGILLALRRAGVKEGRDRLPRYLADTDPDIRRAAIQWVGEERLHEFASLLQPAVSRPPVTKEVFEAFLATQDFLNRGKRKPLEEVGGEEYVAPLVTDAKQPAAIRALALRMLRPDHPALKASLLEQFLTSDNGDLAREAVRTLALRADEPCQSVLWRLALNKHAPKRFRAEAVLGLSYSAPYYEPTRELLLSLIDEFERDVLRSLRGVADKREVAQALLARVKKATGTRTPEKEVCAQLLFDFQPLQDAAAKHARHELADRLGPLPHTESEWKAALTTPGDPEMGERIFFHPRGPRCFACHRVDGRGAAVGPDLSLIAHSLHRDKLIESILSPSKEIAPQFVSWMIATRDGKVRTGVIVDEGPNSTVTIADAQGRLETIPRTEIEERHAVKTSIMPDNLHTLMTVEEFRDLLAFLEARK
jgi:putative membrane-bound dehydrogenase-like protein